MVDHNSWTRVSRHHTCPICGRADNCSVSRDGGFVWCGRISDGAIKENAGGQYLHVLGDDRTPPPAPRPHMRSDVNFAFQAQTLFEDGYGPRAELADLLGVNVSALEALRVGFNRWPEYWTFPERDALGQVVGLQRRLRSGEKRRMTGGRAGLTYADHWDSGEGPILLVEGASDTAALMTMGLNAVGRPSNAGGVDLLIELLADVSYEREILVIGERDQTNDGRWPGREGAIRTAQKLADELDRPVAWAFPPDDAKDSRDWLRKAPSLPADRLASLFLDGLDSVVIEPPPRFTCELSDEPPVPLADWRDQMLVLRIASLRRAGSYLDGSTTGAGKTTVDFQVVQHLLAGESA